MNVPWTRKAAQAIIETETPRLADLANLDPDATLQLIQSNNLRIGRLNIAVRELGHRIDAIDREAARAEYSEEHSKLQEKTVALAEEFAERYPRLRAELIELFWRLDDNKDAAYCRGVERRGCGSCRSGLDPQRGL